MPGVRSEVMYPDNGGLDTRDWSRRMSVEHIRTARFGRTPLGRRGFSEDEVTGFLHRLAEEVSGLEGELANVRAENARIKGALRDWQTRAGGGSGTQTATSTPTEAINLLSRAQR